ncbi:hypothetical protein pb186bvf_001796 [Paramecium bursaria]
MIHSIKVIMIGFSDIEDSDVSDDQEFQQIQPIPVVKRETPIQRIENTIVKVQPTDMSVPIIQEPQRKSFQNKEDIQLELDDLDSIHVPEEEYQLIQEDPPEIKMQKEQQPQIPKNFFHINHQIDEEIEAPVQNQKKIFEKEIEQEQTPNQAITYDKPHQTQFLNTKDFPKNRFYNPKSSAIYKKFISKEYCDFDDIVPNYLEDESQQITEEPDPLLEGLENIISQLMLPPKKIKKFEDRFIKPELPQRKRQGPQKKESKHQNEKTAPIAPIIPTAPQLSVEEQKKKQQEERLNRQAQLEEQKKKNRISQEKKVLQILDKKIYEQGLIKYKCVVQEKSKESTQYLRWSELALISDGSNKVMDFELQTREKHLHHLLKDITSCFTSHKIVDGINQGAQNIHVEQEEEIIQQKSNRAKQYNQKEKKRRQKSQKEDNQQSNSNMNQDKNSSYQESLQIDNNKSHQKQQKQENNQQKQNVKNPDQVQNNKFNQKNHKPKEKRQQIQVTVKVIQNKQMQKQKQQDDEIKLQLQQDKAITLVPSNKNKEDDLFDADAVNIFYLKNQREKRVDKRITNTNVKPTPQATRSQITKPSNQKVIQDGRSQNNEPRRTRERKIEDKRNGKQVNMKQDSDENDTEIKTRKIKKGQQKSYRELSDYSSDENFKNSRKKIRK